MNEARKSLALALAFLALLLGILAWRHTRAVPKAKALVLEAWNKVKPRSKAPHENVFNRSDYGTSPEEVERMRRETAVVQPLRFGPGPHSLSMTFDEKINGEVHLVDAKGNTVLAEKLELVKRDEEGFEYRFSYFINKDDLPEGYVYDIYYRILDEGGEVSSILRRKGDPMPDQSDDNYETGWSYTDTVIYSRQSPNPRANEYTADELRKMTRFKAD